MELMDLFYLIDAGCVLILGYCGYRYIKFKKEKKKA